MSATQNAPSQGLRPIFFRISIGGFCLLFIIVLLFGRIIFEGFGGGVVMNSISDYYYSPSMHNVFVGGLCILAALLICYRYEQVDTLASFLAGICAIGVAIFPKAPDKNSPECPPPQTHIVCPNDLQNSIGHWHYVFAASFFIIIALMALFLFTLSVPLNTLADKNKQRNKFSWRALLRFALSDPPNLLEDKDKKKKKQRNKVYRGCGFAMGILLLANVLEPVYRPGNLGFDPTFLFETGVLILFIFAWIVKGQVLWKDANQGKTSLSEYWTYIRDIPKKALDPFRTISLAMGSPDKSDSTQPQSD